MKLRWIDLGLINPEIGSTTWEYSRKFPMTEPIVFSFRYNKPTWEPEGLYLFSEELIMDNVPNKVHMSRLYMDNKLLNGALLDENVYQLNLHLPTNDNPKIGLLLTRLLRGIGIESVYKNNDCNIIHKNRLKKCSGNSFFDWGNGWTSYNIFISKRVDCASMDIMCRLDTEKFTKKELFNNIEDLCVGLEEYNVDMDKLVVDLINSLSNHLGYELYKSPLDNVEYNKLIKYSDVLNTKKWIYEGVHPEIGDKNI